MDHSDPDLISFAAGTVPISLRAAGCTVVSLPADEEYQSLSKIPFEVLNGTTSCCARGRRGLAKRLHFVHLCWTMNVIEQKQWVTLMVVMSCARMTAFCSDFQRAQTHKAPRI
jgi:hypothetical protein